MDRTEPLIRLDAVSKRFRAARGREDFLAVDRVSLEIAAGERFGIIGSSGAGKSTLLRLINLLETPDAGHVVIDGQELTRLSRRDLRAARAGIGMIFQQFNLLQNATVFDNVAFPLTIQGRLSRAERRDRVEECLAIVGLTNKLASYPAQLSGGQKQRVAIARALATRPAVMLCDEPTSALDSETTRSVLDILADINERLGVTLVVVTHELAVARRLCERIAVMADGRIVEDIVMATGSARLETAIARANRGEPIPDEPLTPAPRRAGGLPLPSKSAAPAVHAAARAAIDERTATANSHWMRHFAAVAERALESGSTVSQDAVARAAPVRRRVGGLPLPGDAMPAVQDPPRQGGVLHV